MTELLVILVVALIVFGPTRLPELARSLGRAMGEFRRASTDLRQTLREATEEPEPRIAPPEAEDPGEPEAAAAREPEAAAAGELEAAAARETVPEAAPRPEPSPKRDE